jgi:hypothetical protein
LTSELAIQLAFLFGGGQEAGETLADKTGDVSVGEIVVLNGSEMWWHGEHKSSMPIITVRCCVE